MAKAKETEETTNEDTPVTTPVPSSTDSNSSTEWSYAELARFQLTGEKPVR
jgi:hypothetical protein